MSSEQLTERLEECQLLVAKTLIELLPSVQTSPSRLHQAMIYSTLAAGKRVRAFLCFATGQALGLKDEELTRQAAAVELIHTYSLVHDDLPAMDDDDLRRGIATCHVAFDEATAILVGDALQALAIQTLATDTGKTETQRIAMITALCKATGSRGMVGGQAMDMDSAGKKLALIDLENLHIHKTGALISTSVELACLASPNITKTQHKQLLHFAHCVGLAFQVQDDILDIEADTEQLGKTSGKDQQQQKSTYPDLIGLKESKQMAKQLIQDAITALDSFDQSADSLRWMADYIIERGH